MTRNYFMIISAGLLLTGLWGCGSSNSDAPSFLGTHPAGWEYPVSHGLQYVAKPEQCTECHGKDLLGGISKVSCSTQCHVHKVPSGYGDWASAHGKQAKGAPAILPGGIVSGFLSCQHCHGREYLGTPLSHEQGCVNASCHKMLPSGALPPHSGFWNDKSNFIGATHTDVNTGNAPACVVCHDRVQTKHFWYNAAYQLYSTPNMLTPPEGAPAGTAPGCFNNTLCHGPRP